MVNLLADFKEDTKKGVKDKYEIDDEGVENLMQLNNQYGDKVNYTYTISVIQARGVY